MSTEKSVLEYRSTEVPSTLAPSLHHGEGTTVVSQLRQTCGGIILR